MTRFYRFAGVDIGFSMPEEMFYTDERRLAPFRVDNLPNPHWFHFETADTLPEPEGICIAKTPAFDVYLQGDAQVRYIDGNSPYMRVVHEGKEHYVQLLKRKFPGTISAKTVLECIAAEHLIAREKGFVFHCSYIDWDGKAILFTAPSETGKSTQADLWHDLRGAEIINGDRAAVRLVGDAVMAEGVPFAGSSPHCKNRSLPLAAIVYLGQAPQTSIRNMRGYEAFSRIWEGISVNIWDKQDVEMVSDVVKKIAETIPVFHMPCTPDESAVLALEQAMLK